jgi:hypothetical protein
MDESEQIPVQPYHPDVFDRLNLFRTAKALLSRNKAYITNLGDVFVNHQMHNIFGVSLLHKHFDLHYDEILVRTIDVRRRVAYSRPASRHTEAVPYLWRALRGPDGRLRFAPLEFVRSADVRGFHVVDLTQHASFLTAVAGALAERDLLDVFGISTMNIRKISLGPDELMVETTDSEKRRLTITPVHRSEIATTEVTETFWTFSPGVLVDIGGILKCTWEHCTGHCQSHCISHCSGHCAQHCGQHCACQCLVHCDHPDPY